MTRRGRCGHPLLSMTQEAPHRQTPLSSLICHRSRARGAQSGSPPLSVTKKGLYVGRYPHSCTISCGLLQELSITGRFFWFICAHPRKGPLLPFLSPFHSKLCRPSYFRAGIYPEILLPLEPLCPIFVTKVPFLSLIPAFWSRGCHF